MYTQMDQEWVLRSLPDEAVEALNNKALEIERSCGGKKLTGARITKLTVSYQVFTEADDPSMHPPETKAFRDYHVSDATGVPDEEGALDQISLFDETEHEFTEDDLFSD